MHTSERVSSTAREISCAAGIILSFRAPTTPSWVPKFSTLDDDVCEHESSNALELDSLLSGDDTFRDTG